MHISAYICIFHAHFYHIFQHIIELDVYAYTRILHISDISHNLHIMTLTLPGPVQLRSVLQFFAEKTLSKLSVQTPGKVLGNITSFL